MQRLTRTQTLSGLVPMMLIALQAGCTSEPPVNRTPHEVMVPDPAQTVGLKLQPWTKDCCEVDPGTPVISVEARFLEVETQLIPQQLKEAPDGAVVLSSADFEQLLARAQEALSSVHVVCPRLSVFSGKGGLIHVGGTQSFLKEPGSIYPPGAGGLAEDPTIGNLVTGRMLAIVPRVENDEVIIEQLDAAAVHALGMRNCSAWVVRGGKRTAVYWQEPVFVDHEVRAPVGPLRVREGEALAVRLSAEVMQPAGRIRLETLNNDVVEEFASDRSMRRIPPRPLECLVLLTARRGPPAEANGNSAKQATQNE